MTFNELSEKYKCYEKPPYYSMDRQRIYMHLLNNTWKKNPDLFNSCLIFYKFGKRHGQHKHAENNDGV